MTLSNFLPPDIHCLETDREAIEELLREYKLNSKTPSGVMSERSVGKQLKGYLNKTGLNK